MVWATEHDGRFPTNFEFILQLNMQTPRLLICPSDTQNPLRKATNWSGIDPALSSYEIVTPAKSLSDTNSVFLRCKLHGHLGYGDGTVFDGVRRRGKFEQ